MTGYMILTAHCFGCDRVFTANPNKVPSIRDKSGVRQPLCEGCATYVREKQLAMGMNPPPIADDAYAPAEEL